MINDKTIAVVVPAYNEETQIQMVLETMPDFVDRIIIVNDCSKDATKDIVKDYIDNKPKHSFFLRKISDKIIKTKYNKADQISVKIDNGESDRFTPTEQYPKNDSKSSIILINHKVNSGVGAAIATGYKWARDHNIDCTAVMAGDGQMDPSELRKICLPIINNEVDYVKGNRLIHRSALFVIPKVRFFGNSVLSILTKMASGYWHVSDTQTGYTAISKGALNAIRLHKIYKSYGMPNDMLVKLNVAFCTVKEVEIKPIYNVGEKSKMKVFKVIPTISWLLIKSFFKRLWRKYLFRDFHPLFLLYHLAFLLFLSDIPFAYYIIRAYFIDNVSISDPFIIAFMFLTISGFQSFLFAMWMDIQDNERLYK